MSGTLCTTCGEVRKKRGGNRVNKQQRKYTACRFQSRRRLNQADTEKRWLYRLRDTFFSESASRQARTMFLRSKRIVHDALHMHLRSKTTRGYVTLSYASYDQENADVFTLILTFMGYRRASCVLR